MQAALQMMFLIVPDMVDILKNASRVYKSLQEDKQTALGIITARSCPGHVYLPLTITFGLVAGSPLLEDRFFTFLDLKTLSFIFKALIFSPNESVTSFFGAPGPSFNITSYTKVPVATKCAHAATYSNDPETRTSPLPLLLLYPWGIRVVCSRARSPVDP
ncbi:hypothetical protein D9619_002317 [Psilocybe cf. subviscida]|uniref:Uncharacterized protein n=1 Tax=Psilocybe cf. subviscida TaxID=2480587 RepID=A0A8H5AVH1_9AGAR|nr:hypothetical protein D9619_002317 [Psilocybe cf. subviscida]